MRYTHRLFPCSLFPVPCSLFPVPCSLFPVPCSLLPVSYSIKCPNCVPHLFDKYDKFQVILT
ncbi:hypothetical protein BJP36_36360 [Moorena producens JHB]|uniref:Uncharacterized protein n=1 Tax=Moorena producens (strain JHB) TaxID=1454205 RepID=A0A9Q9STY5_MOOP1|nr:hypothetical protein [Moorena producens]WAN69563.1 hypothetical protein BJP36_36360 [Moorena producens JHB]